MIATQKLNAPLIRAGNLEVRTATNFAEIDAAMRLRYEVFNLELEEGLESSYERGYDTDAYDAYCDHLIVIDMNSNSIVGTYRLLRRSIADRNIGFYSDNEFDLSNLRKIPGELLELGRSCIAASHRSFATISLLWAAICEYAITHNANYMFGCASLHVSDIEEVQQIYTYLKANYQAPSQYYVHPLQSCSMPVNDDSPVDMDPRIVSKKIPTILKGYLRAGAKICGRPAYDAEFGTADLLVLHELSRMTARYKQHYITGARN